MRRSSAHQVYAGSYILCSVMQNLSTPFNASVDAVLQRYGTNPATRRTALVQILREVQEQTHWLSPETLAHIAQGLGLTPAIVRGVASFYRFFQLEPVAPYQLLWSDNITDQMLGNQALANTLREKVRDLTSVAFTSCTGLGDQGPAVLVNHHTVLTRMNAHRVEQLAALIQAQTPIAQWPTEWQQVDNNIRRADTLLASAPLCGEAIQAMLQRGADATLAEITQSRLRGRGGAGFATAKKWELCRHAPVPAGGSRVVVCNADEGEPGTFKDRVLLTHCADTVLEGMTVAARILGAQHGFLYLRGEYRYLLEHLEAVLARRRAQKLLGNGIGGWVGFDFDITIHLGAGAYVCGEESALIESLEGKRGTPRIRPPFPVESGYLGQPTSVNNVETFCAAAHIASRGEGGGAWWAAIGTAQSSGTKLHSISGDCERPGIYEYPFGVTIAQMLDDCGAQNTQAVQVGGPSGVCLAAHEFERKIGFEDVPTAGAFMVFDQSRDMFEVARNFAHFFAHESCGFCTPCRVGTELVAQRMDKLAAGFGSLFDEAELHELETLLHGTTHCGLGASATNALRDTLQRFRPAFERRLQEKRFVAAFDLDAELASARQATGRNDAHAHLAQRG